VRARPSTSVACAPQGAAVPTIFASLLIFLTTPALAAPIGEILTRLVAEAATDFTAIQGPLDAERTLDDLECGVHGGRWGLV